MKSLKKNISKSVRLSQEVYDYILAYRGNGFNEKFENIILDYRKKEKDIQSQIKKKEKELSAVAERLDKVLSDIYKLEHVTYKVGICLNYASDLEEELKALAAPSED